MFSLSSPVPYLGYRTLCSAALALAACTLLAMAMSHTMLLQHHYGHHMFGDDLAAGARVTVRTHHRRHPPPMQRLTQQVAHVVEEVVDEIAVVEDRIGALAAGHHDPSGVFP